MKLALGAWTSAVVCLLFAGTAAAQNQGQQVQVHLVKDPALRSSAALVLDATGSSVLYARHSDVAMPIASITKLMTSLVVMEAGQPLDEPIDITSEDVAHGRGAFSRLTPGTTLTRGDLMHLALMASENRAAHALGRSYPGGLG